MMRRADFSPDWASAPGETISDLLSQKGLTLDHFARSLGWTVSSARQLISGNERIDSPTAIALSATLGGSSEFWLSRDRSYIAAARRTEEQWVNELPVEDMVRFGWLPEPAEHHQLEQLLQYFDVPSLPAWNERYGELAQRVPFRKSPSFDSHPA